MPGLSDLLGASGVIEQLLLWNVVSQVITNMLSPAFNQLLQNSLASHPNMVITPDILARAVVQTFMTRAEADTEAAKSGLDASRFGVLVDLAQIRLSPAELAEAVLRSYMDLAHAESEAKLQGMTPDRLKVLADLAGDAPGADQLAAALRRGIIKPHGKGAASTSYAQGIAETRLHNKWGPVLEELSKAILSPQDAAQAVVRGFLPLREGEVIAELSGVDPKQFTVMVELAGDAPSPMQLAEGLRRGAIPEDSGNPNAPGFVQGIRQGRLANKWIPLIKALSVLWPTPTDALEALLKGQITHAEALKLYERFGGDPQYFNLLFDTQGESPTPLELITMANRGFIPWSGTGPNETTYQQGFKEGRWKNKWEPVYRKFAEYVPPESTVVTLLSHGVLKAEEAADLLAKQGMKPDLVAAYIDEAHTEALSDYRGATVSLVLSAYHEQILTAKQATPILEALHVTPTAVKLLLAYEDTQRAFEAVTNAVSRTRTLYAARKITLQTAKDSLHRLEIPAATAEGMIKAWQIENSISVKVLTETQIIDAWELKVLTEDEAKTELENIGYTPFDAWVLMSVKAKQKQPGRPHRGPAPPQGQVIPGTT